MLLTARIQREPSDSGYAFVRDAGAGDLLAPLAIPAFALESPHVKRVMH